VVKHHAEQPVLKLKAAQNSSHQASLHGYLELCNFSGQQRPNQFKFLSASAAAEQADTQSTTKEVARSVFFFHC